MARNAMSARFSGDSNKTHPNELGRCARTFSIDAESREGV